VPDAHPAADAVLDVLATTRAIRRYRPDPIPDEDLSRILFAATRAPSGSNRQPFRFVVLRDGPKAVVAKSLLGAAFRSGWTAKQRTDGYDSGSGLDATTRKGRQAIAMQQYVDHFEEIPVVVLACLARYRAANPMEGASVYPACQNLLLAARALGYGGVLTGWHAFVEPELRDLLAIPVDVAMSATITLGVPQGHHGPVRRRPIGEVVFDDGWDQPATWVTEPEGLGHTAGPPRERF
jgi:nitroreductase